MVNYPKIVTLIGWETRRWKIANQAIISCKNYGLKPILKNLFVGELYEKERENLLKEIKSDFIKKTDKIFWATLCQSCFSALDLATQDKVAEMPQFEII
jgi:hypothetical protein